MTNTMAMTNIDMKEMIHQQYLEIIAQREELAAKMGTVQKTFKDRSETQ